MTVFFKWSIPVLIATALLSGCQSVATTQSAVVGVDRKQRMFTMLSQEEVNKMAANAYQQALKQGEREHSLNRDAAEVKRLHRIANRMIQHVGAFRQDAMHWQWEVNLLESEQLNAYCMPGGKIMFYSGILTKLALNDDEVAAIMGHEMAHALREHSRESISQAYGAELGANVVSILLGAGARDITQMVVNYGLTLPNSRTNEAEADLIGLELMARGGYNPEAAVTLWKKMAVQAGNKVPEFMSTHPSHESRIASLQTNVTKVMPLYLKATRIP